MLLLFLYEPVHLLVLQQRQKTFSIFDSIPAPVVQSQKLLWQLPKERSAYGCVF